REKDGRKLFHKSDSRGTGDMNVPCPPLSRVVQAERCSRRATPPARASGAVGLRRNRDRPEGVTDDAGSVQSVRTFPAPEDPARDPGMGAANLRRGRIPEAGSGNRGDGRPAAGSLPRQGRGTSEAQVSTAASGPEP